MRTRSIVGLAVAGLLSLSACGGGTPAAAQSSVAAQASSKAAAAAKAAQAKCRQQLGPFLDALEDLNSRLGIGLTEHDYGQKVGDVKVLYDRIVPEDEAPDCLSNVGVPAEGALNKYISAAQKWSNCFSNVNCDTDSITPQLQGFWSEATDLIAEAHDGLDALSTPPPAS